MAPKLASLRERSLPNPPPPPVTRAISPSMLFILYLLGMNDLMTPSNIAKIDNNRKPITSPIDRRYVILALVRVDLVCVVCLACVKPNWQLLLVELFARLSCNWSYRSSSACHFSNRNVSKLLRLARTATDDYVYHWMTHYTFDLKYKKNFQIIYHFAYKKQIWIIYVSIECFPKENIERHDSLTRWI